MIILNERHLTRLMSSYLLCYHEDRTHPGLAKDTPAGRPAEIRSAREGQIQSLPRLGRLHHRYLSRLTDYTVRASFRANGKPRLVEKDKNDNSG